LKLFKYHRIDKFLIQSLRFSEHWFSRIDSLNDPFDAFFIDATPEMSVSYLKKQFCVCCFSKVNDEILMWSHYADSHRGVCLEFEFPDTKENNASLIEINYDDNLYTLDKIKLDKNGSLILNITDNGSWVRQKLKTWEYEQEVRVIQIENDLSLNGIASKFIGNLKAIYFGFRTDNKDIELVKSVSDQYEGLKYFRVGLGHTTGKMTQLTPLK